jgi:signal transduction histidine kinase
MSDPAAHKIKPEAGVWRTLRFRLAVWNAAVVIITAVVTVVGLRQGVRWALIHELDQVLMDDAREVELALSVEPKPDMEELKGEFTRMAEGHENRGWYVKLLGGNETPIWATPGARPSLPRPPLRREFLPISFSGYRIVENRIPKTADGIELIRVGATLKYINEDMRRIDRGVLLATAAVLLAAPLCGYFLAARAARTVSDITTSASRLRPSHLDERLPIRGSGDELDQLAQTINSLLDRIAAYLNIKRDFLANAAHELRTPLAAIRSSVEVALNVARTPEEYEELMVDVIEECSALETLVNQLLLLSETEADLPASRFERVDLGDLASKSVDMFSGVADARGVELRAATVVHAPVNGNPHHLRQVLNNLIDNAVKYTPAGGEVSVNVTVDAAARAVRVRVSDTGQGISLEEQQHIFERFYRAESARSRQPGTGGTGLGLSICQSVVHNHGGEINCRSVPDVGTTFTVLLPLADSRLEAEPADHVQVV